MTDSGGDGYVVAAVVKLASVVVLVAPVVVETTPHNDSFTSHHSPLEYFITRKTCTYSPATEIFKAEIFRIENG